jgi:cytochrome c5
MPVCKSAIAVAAFLAFGALSVAHGQEVPPRSGEVVFNAACAKCHTGGIGGFFSGGPTVGKKSDWEALAPRGVDGLTGTTLSGIGKMAARGGCTTCTDAEIRAAVAYMLEKSQ